MRRTMGEMAMAGLLLLGLGGCKGDANPCDSTTYYSGSDCLPKTDASLTEEAAAPAIDTASLLGAPCTDSVTHAECQGPDTDYCAVQPGKPGYCTKAGCASAADCPPNWSCFDLSKMGVTGIPPMCTMPAS
jgi:hypothetical protein